MNQRGPNRTIMSITPTVEIKNLRERLAALKTRGTIGVCSDIFHTMQELVLEQTGLKLYDKTTRETLDGPTFLRRMIEQYEGQLAALVKIAGGEQQVRQVDLEDLIAEMKALKE